MPRKRSRQKRHWNNVARIGCVILAVPTLLSLLFAATFPDPANPGTAVSLLGYTLNTHHLWPVIYVFAPLILVCALGLLYPKRPIKLISIILMLIATCGYWHGVLNIFGDFWFDESIINNVASGLQIIFFTIITPLYTLSQAHIPKTLKVLARPEQYPHWLNKTLHLLFPKFSEINYLALFWATVLMVFIHPELSSEFADLRLTVMAGVAVYLSWRMLGNKPFGHEAKDWIAFAYYGFLAFLATMSLIAQLADNGGGATLWQGITTTLTAGLLAIWIIRLIIVSIISRTYSREHEELLTRRFSDEQYDWIDFVATAGGGIVILGIVGEFYHEPATHLLMTYVGIMILHSFLKPLRQIISRNTIPPAQNI